MEFSITSTHFDADETMVYCFQRDFIGYDMTITSRYPPIDARCPPRHRLARPETESNLEPGESANHLFPRNVCLYIFVYIYIIDIQGLVNVLLFEYVFHITWNKYLLVHFEMNNCHSWM
jgi:hypothetical protein